MDRQNVWIRERERVNTGYGQSTISNSHSLSAYKNCPCLLRELPATQQICPSKTVIIRNFKKMLILKDYFKM